MHIAEGVLTTQVLAGGGGIAAIGTAIGLKKLDYERVPRVAILSSAFFVASLIHIPVGPSSTHLILNGLLGLILGWVAFPAILVALILQVVLFQFGGFTTLGVNTVNMALPAVIVWMLFNSAVQKATNGQSNDQNECSGRRKNNSMLFLSGFSAGFIAVLLSGIFTSTTLLLSGSEFLNAAKLIVISHIPVMIIEGIVTGSILVFLKKVKPEVLQVGYALVQKM
ncbi:MAG: cobalt transporter CbiM [Spirochaetes bacterium]|nr:MAG: cobalt transporter CbiM [Spirochaetota bacterium]